jgi:alpha-beta hydrolase superfamily lysophospholipase
MAGWSILQHGIRADKSTLIERAKFISQAGYSVLLFDFQAHGESIGKKITLGFLESRDSQAAVEFVHKRFSGKPVAVIGVSLGAAAATLALPPLDVQAMVLEMSYSTIIEATKDRIEIRLGPAGRIMSPLLTAQIPFRIGCSVDDLRPMISVEKITAPKLFLAGTLDRDTKFSEAKEIFDHAAEPKYLVSFEGARHEDFLRFDPQKYKHLVLKFLDENLK